MQVRGGGRAAPCAGVGGVGEGSSLCRCGGRGGQLPVQVQGGVGEGSSLCRCGAGGWGVGWRAAPCAAAGRGGEGSPLCVKHTG